LSAQLHRQGYTADDHKLAGALFGQQNRHLRQIEQLTGVRASSSGQELLLEGAEPQVAYALRLVEELADLLTKGFPLRSLDIEYADRILRCDPHSRLVDIFLDTVVISSRNKAIAPKSLAQKTYVDAIRAGDVTFGIGPAGTGKTYLAMAMAVAFLQKKEVSRIVLVRPAKPEKNSVFSPATWRRRSIRICGHCTMRCSIWWISIVARR
jgi:phosphate starvation-inducible protein PhoH and related proteins